MSKSVTYLLLILLLAFGIAPVCAAVGLPLFAVGASSLGAVLYLDWRQRQFGWSEMASTNVYKITVWTYDYGSDSPTEAQRRCGNSRRYARAFNKAGHDFSLPGRKGRKRCVHCGYDGAAEAQHGAFLLHDLYFEELLACGYQYDYRAFEEWHAGSALSRPT